MQTSDLREKAFRTIWGHLGRFRGYSVPLLFPDLKPVFRFSGVAPLEEGPGGNENRDLHSGDCGPESGIAAPGTSGVRLPARLDGSGNLFRHDQRRIHQPAVIEPAYG